MPRSNHTRVGELPPSMPPLAVTLAQIDTARRDWLAALPETFGPVQGYEAADQAYRQARAAVRNLKFAYGGTIPPPPWPMHPELQTAVKNMKIFRDGFDVFSQQTPGARWPRNSGKMGPAFTRAGDALFSEVGALMKRSAAGLTVADVKKGLSKLFPDVGSAVFVAGLMWLGRREIARMLAPASRGGRRRILA